MSEIIPVNFDDAVEPKPVPAGRYALQVTACDVAKTGAQSKVPGSPQFKVSLGFEDQSLNAPNITHYISLPNGAPDDNVNFKVLLLKRFLEAFRVAYDRTQIDVHGMATDMLGASATLEVTQTEPDDNGNVYNRIVLPKIKG